MNMDLKKFQFYYNTVLNVSSLQDGVYFLIVKFADEAVSKKVMINH